MRDNVPLIDNSGPTSGLQIENCDDSSDYSSSRSDDSDTSPPFDKTAFEQELDNGDVIVRCLFGGCCGLPICWLLFAFIAAMKSKGLTECPTVPITNQAHIPAIHTVSTPALQWYNWFWKEHSVYNPSISNTTRMGYWRDTRTYMFRRQYAYVPENSTSAHIIVSTPLFAWTSTFHLEHCYPPVAYKLSENWQWGWQWGKNVKTTEIYRDDKDIATATLEKDIQWSDWMLPDGWNIAVKSNVVEGIKVAEAAQTISDYYVENSDWTVKDYRPDLVEPFVLSFVAVAER